MFNVTGKFIEASQVFKVSDSFTYRKFWLDITNGGNYQNVIEFQLTYDNVDLTSGLFNGDEITVYFTIRGRKSTKTNPDGTRSVSFFQNCVAFKIEKITRVSTVPSYANSSAPAAAVYPNSQVSSITSTPSLEAFPVQVNPDDDDALPF